MTPPGFDKRQAALQRAIKEMGPFNSTLSTLQTDVTSVKTTQGKMKADVAATLRRFNEVESTKEYVVL